MFFTPTLENFQIVQERSDYMLYAKNSLITSVAVHHSGLDAGCPAAYAMAFFKGKYTKDILMWMLSTKMMPAVGALVPVYVMAQTSHLLDTRTALVIVFTLSNLPIMVWMLYSHLKEIPNEILEASRMDGATLWSEFRYVLLPLTMGGLASTGLLTLVLSWNEAFWSLNLSAAKAGTLATLIASYSSPEGLFWAKLSAASLHGDWPHRGLRLVQPEAAGPRPDLRRRQVTANPPSFSRFQETRFMSYLQLSGVEKLFGEHRVIKGIDLAIKQGEFIVFVGPSGCGKSTLLRLIAGLETIDGGSLQLDGRDITHQPSSKRDLAMVFQSYALYPHMSVFENMSFALKLANVDPAIIKDKVDRTPRKILNLTNYLQRTPKELSGGQRQRVAIGRAIVRAPKVFLFDEPLSNLDAALRGQTRIEIAKLHRDLGATTIYVTHDQVEAMTLADRVVVLRDGNIEQVGTPLELYDRPANQFVAQFIGTPQMNVVEAAKLPSVTTVAGVQVPALGSIGLRPESITLVQHRRGPLCKPR